MHLAQFTSRRQLAQFDPRRQFVTMQTRLAANDALNEYITHTASAIFVIPPGTTATGYVGETLLGAAPPRVTVPNPAADLTRPGAPGAVAPTPPATPTPGAPAAPAPKAPKPPKRRVQARRKRRRRPRA